MKYWINALRHDIWEKQGRRIDQQLSDMLWRTKKRQTDSRERL